MLLIGIKGHAGMSPCRNFGKGYMGQAKKGPHKTKNNTPTWRKKVAERPSKGGRKPSTQEKRRKIGLHIEKKRGRKAFKW